MTDWRLTDGEIKQVSYRYWPKLELTFLKPDADKCIAEAQARKLVLDLEKQLPFYISALSQLDLFQSPYWQALRKELGLEKKP